jgi:hypothetical protein
MENQVEVKKSNPLAGYFRHPEIYLRLPSQGRFWPDGSLNLPANNEIPVYPMTTKDEIMLRTPDALLNGSGVVNVIQSCCPNIVDAWNTPSIDVDAVLIAIRIATYGHSMDFDTKCPHCKEDNTHAIDLRPALESISCPDYSNKVLFNDIKIKLKPQPYFTANKSSMIGFEEQKIINTLNNTEVPDDIKAIEITKSMQRLTDISIDTVTDSTEYIEMPDGNIVSNRDHLREFYINVENKLIKQIQSVLVKFNDETQLNPQKVSCNSCGEPYNVPIIFDYSNFFGKGF